MLGNGREMLFCWRHEGFVELVLGKLEGNVVLLET